MTDKFEQQFFRCFGIELRELDYPDNFTYYPEITDSILLDLICLLNNDVNVYDTEYQRCTNRKKLKLQILKDCVYNKELIDKQVQKLFKE